MELVPLVLLTGLAELVPPKAKVEPVPPQKNLLFQAPKATKFYQFVLKTQKIHSISNSVQKIQKRRQKISLRTIITNCSKARVEHVPPLNGNGIAKSKSLLLLLLILLLLVLKSIASGLCFSRWE